MFPIKMHPYNMCSIRPSLAKHIVLVFKYWGFRHESMKTDSIHRLFKTLGFFFPMKFTWNDRAKKASPHPKRNSGKDCFLSFHFPSTSISKYYLAGMHS